ncbi:hypothetical protein JQ581_32015 [Bradyrhizobium liaoningense]|uniref:hypothetical protein n=1 Tax=Bradyrhizobium liaoningense TaxID=43992 RepID=UPI001BA49423|nr:hypothetical protein [Bradyrhizobium liaoningense]MBR0741569.1 hypothetical protein [Bradyrhizobium liaoningense]
MRYLVDGTNEYGSSNLGRGSATTTLRLARKLLREGYMDVRVCTPRGRVLQSNELDELKPLKESDMAKSQQCGNREAKKPKKEKAKVIAAAPSRKEVAWQPDFGSVKKKYGRAGQGKPLRRACTSLPDREPLMSPGRA